MKKATYKNGSIANILAPILTVYILANIVPGVLALLSSVLKI